MAKILWLTERSTKSLQRSKQALLAQLRIPTDAIRASCVEQFLTCGKKNCRCSHGFKHGPFHYLAQSLETGRVGKFLLKNADQKRQARESIAGYVQFRKQLEELSQINTELLRRGCL